MRTKKTLVVNLFAGPSTGKSSTMAGLFSELKWRGLDCEMAPEFAKEKVWEESKKILSNQIYVFGKQLHTIHRVMGKVDCVITDSPLLLSLIYGKNQVPSFEGLVTEVFNQQWSLNIFLKRLKKFNPNGRLQNEEQAKQIDRDILAMLKRKEVDFIEIDSKPDSTILLADMVQETIGKDKFKYS